MASNMAEGPGNPRCKLLVCPDCRKQVYIFLPQDWAGEHRIVEEGESDRMIICRECGTYIPVKTTIPWEGGEK